MNIKIKHQCEDSLKFPPAYYSSLCNMKSFIIINFGERTSRFSSPTCLSSQPSIRKIVRVPGFSMTILKIPRALLEVINGQK